MGKPLGLLGARWLTIRLGYATLPTDASWSHMLGVGILAGIGFITSIFTATLGLGEVGPLLPVAKLAILATSLIAGVVGMVILSRTAPAATTQG